MAVDLRMKILLVERYSSTRKIVRDLLQRLGFTNVTVETDATGALSKLREGYNEPYSLVISNWSIEPVSGAELLQSIRADNKLKDTPFLMLLGQTNTNDVITSEKVDLYQSLVMPFNDVTLKTKLVAILGDF
ncbi:two-component system response regulator [Nonlabens sp. MB-3u-79]|jgi:two-component system chemotaxis response regulator CheY|uniref:response regulator n=1 Tax=Nonlabens sp. MB-3u-79 TaxID=2058134 RepID=UPI000C30836F|nr:response regulator [Nonlabens sp. MB-3u-79]AUC78272.1 two-component system response regulator [Nonlabens sp. MB-3u-79]